VTTNQLANGNSDGNTTLPGSNQVLMTSKEEDDLMNDPNKNNYNFKNVESVTLSSVQTKTISYDEEGNEFEEISDEDENQNHILRLKSNPNDDIQLIEENVIQEENCEDQDEVIVSDLSQQQNNNGNSYVSTTTTITHLYISPEPPEDVIKK